jgi:hypothetical protein
MGGSQLTPGEGIGERLQEQEKSYDFCLLMTAAAILPIAIGFIITSR